MASKYKTIQSIGDSAHVNFRTADVTATDASYDFTLTPYAYTYLNIAESAGRVVQSVRGEPGIPVHIPSAW
jgi:hypothetical protein